MVKLNNLKQAYVDLRLNKQLDEHDKFKARIEDTRVEIVQTTKILDVAEFEVDQYKSVLRRTEIEVISLGEKLKEMSKLIAIIEARTKKAHIVWKSISSAELIQEAEELDQKTIKLRMKRLETLRELR